MEIPAGNPMTEEGVKLGRKLFFDPILSGDSSLSCGGCHLPKASFADPNRVSEGINGDLGRRNAPVLVNLGWMDRTFWDGAAASLEEQVFEPVTNPEEMAAEWPAVVKRLRAHPSYPEMFRKAFGTKGIDSVRVARAIAQFERTLISGDSKFDKFQRGEVNLTPAEQAGLDVYMSEDKGDCFHCHGTPSNPLWTDNNFHNNALDETFDDLGLGGVTGNASDNGLFKTPTLRNLAFSAPYMHDGRFETLDEVIDHYSEGLVHSPTVDPLMKEVDEGGVHLNALEKEKLKAFLLTLSDSAFVKDPRFQDPDG